VQQRRTSEESRWDRVFKFIDASTEYRVRDEVTQKYQVENIEALKNQVKTQNGRVFSLEKWKEEIEIKIKEKKDNSTKTQAIITVIATIVMAVSAAIMIFKK